MKTFYACLAGLSIFIIAIGINRFAYGPIIPFLINDHWLSTHEAGYIGSANYLGYLFGAFGANWLSRKMSIRSLLLWVLFVSLIASALSALNYGASWLGSMRFIVGIIGGILMVIAPSVILQNISESKKAVVSGVMFAGIGIGIIVASLSISYFHDFGDSTEIWIGMALMTLVLIAISLPKCLHADPKPHPKREKTSLMNTQRMPFFIACLGYGLYSIGLTPSLLFLSDYAHRDLGISTDTSAVLFSLVGLGAVIGSVGASWLKNRIGAYWTLLLTSLTGLISLLLIVFGMTHLTVFISAFLAGFYLIGIVALMSLFTGELVGMGKHPQYWSIMTLVYALCQFGSSYVFSFIMHHGVSYHNIFIIGTLIVAASFIVYAFSKKPPAQLKES